jgi:hypothetical protein
MLHAPRPESGSPVALLARQPYRKSFGTDVGDFQFRKQPLRPVGKDGGQVSFE